MHLYTVMVASGKSPSDKVSEYEKNHFLSSGFFGEAFILDACIILLNIDSLKKIKN